MNSPIILFDGICNLCNSSVNFIIKKDKNRIFRFAALQTNAGQRFLQKYNLSQKDFDTVIIITDEKVFVKSDAALKILGQLKTFLKILLVFKIVPKFLRDKIYDFIAKNRYKWFGKRECCIIPSNDVKKLFLE